MFFGGKDVVLREELDENRKQIFDRIAERMGTTGTRITRQQFDAFAKKVAEEREGRGPAKPEGEKPKATKP